MNKYISKVVGGGKLSCGEVKEVLSMIFKHQASDMETAMFFTAVHTRGETAEELLGCLEYFEERSMFVNAPEDRTVDIVGTGGDFSGTFNVSTGAALVVAGGGVKVAKHGGRSITSKSGSMDVVEALGLHLSKSSAEAEKMLREVGCTFLFAPNFNPSFRERAETRVKMGIRTVLNLLGPLLNPARVKRQVIGLYDKKFMMIMAEALKKRGSKDVIIVHSLDGLDEFSINEFSEYVHLQDGEITRHILDPRTLGIKGSPMTDLMCDSSEMSARMIEGVLKGKEGGPREIVVLNAAAGFIVGGVAEGFEEGIVLAKESIDSGRAYGVLEGLRRMKV